MKRQLDARVTSARIREVACDEPKELAYAIGVSLSTIYNYMAGRIPSTEVLFRIAEHTGRPMGWFLAKMAEQPQAKPTPLSVTKLTKEPARVRPAQTPSRRAA